MRPEFAMIYSHATHIEHPMLIQCIAPVPISLLTRESQSTAFKANNIYLEKRENEVLWLVAENCALTGKLVARLPPTSVAALQNTHVCHDRHEGKWGKKKIIRRETRTSGTTVNVLWFCIKIGLAFGLPISEPRAVADELFLN